MIEQARALSAHVHAEQRDKLGAPYAAHPARVARNAQSHPGFAALSADDQGAIICAGYLHDVVEDGPDFGFVITVDDLRERGFSATTAEIVGLLTKPAETGDLDPYYAAIAAHPLARMVKLADIADNTNAGRAAKLPTEMRNRLATKYVHALDMLSLSSEERGWLEELQQKDV